MADPTLGPVCQTSSDNAKHTAYFAQFDPTKSAYHQLNGQKYDWNAYPMAPPGTRAVIYEDPDARTSW